MYVLKVINQVVNAVNESNYVVLILWLCTLSMERGDRTFGISKILSQNPNPTAMMFSQNSHPLVCTFSMHLGSGYCVCVGGGGVARAFCKKKTYYVLHWAECLC